MGASFWLTEDKVVGTEDLSERSGAYRVHGARLQVHQDGTGNVLAAGGLVVVDVDPFQLEVRVAMVGTSRVDTVLVRDDFPELEGVS